jgi:hypothetical protein
LDTGRATRGANRSFIDRSDGKQPRFSIGGKLAPTGLRQSFKNRRKMGRINRLGFAVAGGKVENRTCDLILLFCGEPADRIEGLVEELCHENRIGFRLAREKGSVAAVILGEPHSDLTIPSVIFLASPKSIIVLSR